MNIKWMSLLLFVTISSSQAYEPTPVNEKILELLNEYSPEGIDIVTRYIEIENSLNPADPSEFLTSPPFTDENIVKSLPVVVHESHHGLLRYGQELIGNFIGRGDIAFDHGYYYFTADDFSLVKTTKTFPSRELVKLFPDSIQNQFLYLPYLEGMSEIQSTQVSGIFGLLGEYCAYYRSAKTTADLYGFYEKMGPEANWQRFLIDITFYLYATSEFRYFILTYLDYAEQNHPDIYKQLISHKPFIYTLFEIDQLIEDLFAYYLEGRQHVFQLLKSYGWNVWTDDMFLYIKKDKRTQKWPHLINARQENFRLMQQDHLQRQEAAMKASIDGWDKALFMEDLVAMSLRLPEHTEYVDEAWEPFENLHIAADDPIKDAPYSFIDFTKAGVALNSDGSMWIHMQMSKIPDKLPCGQPDVRPSVFEYTWELIFSVLGDTTTYYTINLYEYYGPEPFITNIAAECVASVYDNVRYIQDIEIEKRQVDNTLVLHIKPNKHFQIAAENARFYFRSSHTTADGKECDYLPDYRMPNTMALDKPDFE